MYVYPFWYNKAGLEAVHGKMYTVPSQTLSQVTTSQTKLPDGSDLVLRTIHIPGTASLAG